MEARQSRCRLIPTRNAGLPYGPESTGPIVVTRSRRQLDVVSDLPGGLV